MYEENDVGSINEMIEVAHEEYSKDPNEFEKLLNDAEKPLYEGCKKFTKLSTLVKLYNLKLRYGWSDISFSELLKTLKEILPTSNEIPTSMYEAKKTLEKNTLMQLNVLNVVNQEVLNRIDEISKTCADKESSPNDVLTQALGTRESSERVRGVGRFVTPSTYFHTSKRSKRRNEEIDKLSEENEKFHLRVQELENIHISTQFTPTSAHGSCSRPRLEYDIQCKKNVENEVVKEEVNVDVIILNDLQEDAIEVRNEKEVVCESNIKMSLPLKTILIFGEKVMDKDSGICYQLPFSLFGIGRKTCVLREDIINFCNMREVKTLTLVAYMTRLMASKPNQLVLAPFNPSGHWALLAINAYDETVYYLDSLRTTSRVDIRYLFLGLMTITIFRSQKNIQTSRKQPIWKTVKCLLQVAVIECGYYVMRYMRDIITNGSIVVTDLIDTRTSYSQLELDEVRMELADFLGGHM
ncbi:uncharacterized protein E6C27_scaffold125G002470 [Cucumis melo var. makuwa]|uniref:Ubiquitin-like protease family profile domain-containing protein n=1 Tax=Cucumis melo var. makuwa TaxID=1194695 RepID=A0A5A7TI82_CUCMM|nr:uncharacterized protein E6C27_scaffold125G002470 [Cucumis melo var. makuwa]